MGALIAAGAVSAMDIGLPSALFAAGLRGADIDAAVKAAFDKYKGLNEGKNADYIPALAQVPSTYFGVAVVGADGKVHEAGDTTQLFSIQSISKVLTAALVMQESGANKLEETVGVDATGQRFNSITAIGNIKGSSPDEVWNKIIKIHSDFAGRQLDVNQPVYKSESDTNQRNRAIGMLMSAYERFPMDPSAAVDLYTRQCSINVSARDLATMAATLAFGGRNPVTGKQVLDAANVPGVLAIMATAGMYDDSGKWLYETGLPTKSGVGGGLMAVSPGKVGIGTFAPPLDGAGNSVRGQRAINDIAAALKLNPYAQFS
jgi:glutaminase